MESKDRVVDQAIAEYRAYCAGQLSAQLGTTEAPDGAVEYCGGKDDPADWAICYVRASDDAVRPLVVGQHQRVLDEFTAMDRRGLPFWDPFLFPPPVAVIGGHEYPFKAARGRHLLGVVKLERQAVLLAAADDRLIAVLLVDGVATKFPLGRPRALREVDVDLLRAFSRPYTAATTKPPDDPLRPSPRTKAHHIRIVPGRRVELGDGPTVAEVLEAAFEDIRARATTPPKKPLRRKQPATPGKQAPPGATKRRPKLIGKEAVPLVLEYLRRMALRGCQDLVGLSGDIIRAIRAQFKDFKITSEAFADALRLIAATGTCLIAPHEGGERVWQINLAGLSDPTSAHHLRLCRETRSRVRLEEAAANQRAFARVSAAQADTQASPVAGMDVPNEGPVSSGQPGDHSAADAGEEAPGDVADTRNTAESAPAGEARGTPAGPDVRTPSTGCSAGPTPSTTSVTGHGLAPDAGPACPDAVIAARAEVLDLVDRLGMNPIGGLMLLLWALIHFEELHTATSDDVARPGDAPPQAETTPRIIAANEGAAHVECASPDVDGVTTAEPPLQDDESTPNSSNIQHVARRTSFGEVPPLHPRHALTPVQPAPRCRDLGTLGPRGPPLTRCG